MKHRSLDQIEAIPDRPQDRPRPLTGAQLRAIEMDSIWPLGSWNCWCGYQHAYHDWPGKAEGRPHPR